MEIDNFWSDRLLVPWHRLGTYPVPAAVADWLSESASMTKRLGRYCQQVRVEVLAEGFVDADALADEALLLPQSRRYWLREVLMYGDQQPWLRGRTLLPESTLTGQEKQLMALGNRPLGQYLFSCPSLARDFIEIQRQNQLWARRSRLRLSDKPLLLTECFLSAAPIYSSIPS